VTVAHVIFIQLMFSLSTPENHSYLRRAIKKPDDFSSGL